MYIQKGKLSKSTTKVFLPFRFFNNTTPTNTRPRPFTLLKNKRTMRTQRLPTLQWCSRTQRQQEAYHSNHTKQAHQRIRDHRLLTQRSHPTSLRSNRAPASRNHHLFQLPLKHQHSLWRARKRGRPIQISNLSIQNQSRYRLSQFQILRPLQHSSTIRATYKAQLPYLLIQYQARTLVTAWCVSVVGQLLLVLVLLLPRLLTTRDTSQDTIRDISQATTRATSQVPTGSTNHHANHRCTVQAISHSSLKLSALQQLSTVNNSLVALHKSKHRKDIMLRITNFNLALNHTPRASSRTSLIVGSKHIGLCFFGDNRFNFAGLINISCNDCTPRRGKFLSRGLKGSFRYTTSIVRIRITLGGDQALCFTASLQFTISGCQLTGTKVHLNCRGNHLLPITLSRPTSGSGFIASSLKVPLQLVCGPFGRFRTSIVTCSSFKVRLASLRGGPHIRCRLSKLQACRFNMKKAISCCNVNVFTDCNIAPLFGGRTKPRYRAFDFNVSLLVWPGAGKRRAAVVSFSATPSSTNYNPRRFHEQLFRPLYHHQELCRHTTKARSSTTSRPSNHKAKQRKTYHATRKRSMCPRRHSREK